MIVSTKYFIPGKLTDLVKHFVFLLCILAIFVNGAHGDDTVVITTDGVSEPRTAYNAGGASPSSPIDSPAPRAERDGKLDGLTQASCDKIKSDFGARAFLLKPDIDVYCASGCKFLDLKCPVHVERTSSTRRNAFNFTNFLESIDRFANNSVSVGDLLEDPITIDDAIVDATWAVMERMVGVAMAVVPVLLNQWKVYNFWSSLVLTVVFVMSNYLIGMPMVVVVHNTAVAWMCLASSSNSNHMVEALGGSLIVIIVMPFMFLGDWRVTVGLTIGLIVLYCAFLNHLFWSKRPGSGNAIVITLIQIAIAADQLKYARKAMVLDTIHGLIIEIFIGTVFPCGRYTSYIGNAFNMAFYLTGKFKMVDVGSRVSMFLCVFMMQMVGFMMFRASLGAYYLYSLRYKFTVESLSEGFMVYLTDAFGPVRYVIRIIFRYETPTPRRTMYAVVGLMLAYSEICWAYEFFFIKILASVIDAVFLANRYGKAVHYLEFNINFDGRVFPQNGALAWKNLNDIVKLGHGFVKLSCQKGDVAVTGSGLLMKRGMKTVLYTVAHVVKYADSVQIGDHALISPKWTTLGGSSDPVMVTKVDVDDMGLDLGSVDVLSADDLPAIESLLFLSKDRDGEVMMNHVSTFMIDKSELKVSVDLKAGDSGSPVFACLKDGIIRYAGAVSKGSFNKGAGNIMSFVLAKVSDDDHSSDGSYAGDVRKFNAARRHPNVDSGEAVVEAAINRLNRRLKAERGFMYAFKHHKTKIKLRDMDKTRDDVELFVNHLVDADNPNQTPLEQGRDDGDGGIDGGNDGGGGDDRDDGPEGKRKRRQGAKRRNKDRAARKRAYEVLQLILGDLRLCYHAKDVSVLFNQFAHGNVPELVDFEVADFVDGQWVITDWDGKIDYFKAARHAADDG